MRTRSTGNICRICTDRASPESNASARTRRDFARLPLRPSDARVPSRSAMQLSPRAYDQSGSHRGDRGVGSASKLKHVPCHIHVCENSSAAQRDRPGAALRTSHGAQAREAAYFAVFDEWRLDLIRLCEPPSVSSPLPPIKRRAGLCRSSCTVRTTRRSIECRPSRPPAIA